MAMALQSFPLESFTNPSGKVAHLETPGPNQELSAWKAPELQLLPRLTLSVWLSEITTMLPKIIVLKFKSRWIFKRDLNRLASLLLAAHEVCLEFRKLPFSLETKTFLSTFLKHPSVFVMAYCAMPCSKIEIANLFSSATYFIFKGFRFGGPIYPPTWRGGP